MEIVGLFDLIDDDRHVLLPHKHLPIDLVLFTRWSYYLERHRIDTGLLVCVSHSRVFDVLLVTITKLPRIERDGLVGCSLKGELITSSRRERLDQHLWSQRRLHIDLFLYDRTLSVLIIYSEFDLIDTRLVKTHNDLLSFVELSLYDDMLTVAKLPRIRERVHSRTLILIKRRRRIEDKLRWVLELTKRRHDKRRQRWRRLDLDLLGIKTRLTKLIEHRQLDRIQSWQPKSPLELSRIDLIDQVTIWIGHRPLILAHSRRERVRRRPIEPPHRGGRSLGRAVLDHRYRV